jgi:hypothetical protein
MKIILNYTAAILIIYFSVNWAANNPEMVKTLRNQMNEIVSAGAEQIKKAAGKIERSI